MPLTTREARSALRDACAAIGVDCDDAELIRLGENAMFISCRADVVVRISRGLAVLRDARKEIAVARWLKDSGVDVITPLPIEQPIIVQGKPVTFWRVIKDSGITATLPELAESLRRLHALSVPAGLDLPQLDMFDRVGERIEAADAIPGDDRGFLRRRLAELRDGYHSLSFNLECCAIHGDAHDGNLMRTPSGRIVMIDLERFAFGHPEADLTVTATEYLAGWHSEEDYRAFADAYGFDVMQWSGFPVMRAANELKMTTWLMQNVAEDPRIADEFANRMASLRDDATPRHWQPF